MPERVVGALRKYVELGVRGVGATRVRHSGRFLEDATAQCLPVLRGRRRADHRCVPDRVVRPTDEGVGGAGGRAHRHRGAGKVAAEVDPALASRIEVAIPESPVRTLYEHVKRAR